MHQLILADGGIIPARAGFTARPWGVSDRGPDHPRSRGVYLEHGLEVAAALGSSPLARGLHVLGPDTESRLRIIPARAGFTCPGTTECILLRDHPRSRGVYEFEKRLSLTEQGSSPLARGLPTTAWPLWPWRRIIPARAGFTAAWAWCARRHSDHPRSRGVYLPMSVSAIAKAGSSPLARGLLQPVLSAVWTGRIIPARAGFTTAASMSSLFIRDHPRSRGVYFSGDYQGPSSLGSSPLARGLRFHWCSFWVSGRIIPARAGFTGAPCGAR